MKSRLRPIRKTKPTWREGRSSHGGSVDENNNDRKFLPRFSIQQLMLVMVGFAVVSMILGWSIRGSLFAYGIGLSMIGLVVPFLFYAIIFGVSQLFVGFHRSRQPPQPSHLPVAPPLHNGASPSNEADESSPVNGAIDSGSEEDIAPTTNADSVASPTIEGDLS